VCASQQDTGEQPGQPLPYGPSPLSYDTLQRSRILITYRPPPQKLPASGHGTGNRESPSNPESRNSRQLSDNRQKLDNRRSLENPRLLDNRPKLDNRRSLDNPRPDRSRRPALAARPPQSSQKTQQTRTPQQAQTPHADGASASASISGLLNLALVIVGAVLAFGSRVTLTRTWAWSWHTGSGAALTLSRMHGVCTSAMGELAQGVSGNVATHCLWVDGMWTATAGLGLFGCLLAAFGLIRMLRAMVKSS
jgi:hypothetical protein